MTTRSSISVNALGDNEQLALRASTALVFPLLSNKRAHLTRFIHALQSDWPEDHAKRHRGIPEESWFLQSTPQGDVVIGYLEGEEPAYVFAEIAVSRQPFDVWFRTKLWSLSE